MDAERWKKIDVIVDGALDLPDDERADFVARECDGDEALRQEVLELLTAQKLSESFLNESAMHVAAAAIAEDTTIVADNRLIGKMIGNYRIDRLLGAGGMGEVYFAFDEKLQRPVALKVLPPEYSFNDERVKRFELEARAISKLNHPNIVTIYDVGNFEGVNYIATEFVEGKNLRELIGKGFKLRNIILNSVQICDAIAAAHNAGIVHRDIKPENIMIRRDGYAKILDFGLAKLTDVDPDQELDLAKTTKGSLIGTPAYMSPSQITSTPVDGRTDLWSCGVVLYEFLTGKNPFKRPTRQATFKAILSEDPPVCSSINQELPAELDMIIGKLMEKDPDLGYQSAADLRADLKRVLRQVDSSPSVDRSNDLGSGSAETEPSRRVFAAVGAGVLLLLITAGAVWYFSRQPTTVSGTGTDWNVANSEQLTNDPGTEFFPSISPDGKSFVYARSQDSDYDIYLQRIGGKNATNLTEGFQGDQTQPAFSPDGERIAFRSDAGGGGIYVMGTTRENPKRVADFGYHPSWSPDGNNLVVSTFGRDRPTVRENGDHGLSTIDLRTGERREILKGLASFPAWSPGGHRIAYWYYGGSIGRSDIATIPVNGGDAVTVTEGFGVLNWNPVWSPDGQYLYFVSNKGGHPGVWRIRIDELTGKALSEPEPIGTPSRYSRHLSFSRDGKRMVYVQTDLQSNIQGVNFDAAKAAIVGEPFWITQGDREVTRAELSPDGTTFQMRQIRRTQDDIVTVSRDGSEWRDITDDEPFDRYSRWSPDGTKIAFNSDRSGVASVWICDADGSNLRQLTTTVDDSGSNGFPVWSPDGTKMSLASQTEAYIMDLSKPQAEQTLLKLPRTDSGARFIAWDWSPDGKKLAGMYGSPDLGGVFFDLETQKYQRFSSTAGSVPSWLPDSRHLVYTDGNSIILFDTQTLRSRKLFSTPIGEPRSPFVSRDGKLLYYVVHRGESDIWLLDLTTQ